MVVGCHNSGSPTGPAIIVNDREYVQADQQASELAQEPLRHFGDGEPLAPNEAADLKTARALYDSMFDYRPTEPFPRFVGGEIREALGDHEGAIKALTTYITSATTQTPTETLKVNIADAHFILADALGEEGKWKDALDQINLSLQAFPGVSQYLVTRANIEWNSGRQDLAKLDIGDALRSEPTNARGLKLKKAWNLK